MADLQFCKKDFFIDYVLLCTPFNKHTFQAIEVLYFQVSKVYYFCYTKKLFFEDHKNYVKNEEMYYAFCSTLYSRNNLDDEHTS